MASPEANYIDIVWFKRNPAHLFSVKGVGHIAKAGFNALHEPLGIEGRNVRAAAGTDNHVMPLKLPLEFQPVSSDTGIYL